MAIVRILVLFFICFNIYSLVHYPVSDNITQDIQQDLDLENDGENELEDNLKEIAHFSRFWHEMEISCADFFNSFLNIRTHYLPPYLNSDIKPPIA